MTTKLYVGNLGYNADNSTVQRWFSPHGSVKSINVITDRSTDQCVGYGFVEMSTEEEAQAAIDALDGSEFNGYIIKVAQAKPKKNRLPRTRRNAGGRGGFRSERGGGGGYGRDHD